MAKFTYTYLTLIAIDGSCCLWHSWYTDVEGSPVVTDGLVTLVEIKLVVVRGTIIGDYSKEMKTLTLDIIVRI